MAGRHKKPVGETKSYMLRIRMTPEDRELLERAAKEKSSAAIAGEAAAERYGLKVLAKSICGRLIHALRMQWKSGKLVAGGRDKATRIWELPAVKTLI